MKISAAILLLVILSVPALGGDGVIEINQAAAEAGDVTPGDAPGFPVTISEAGSYRLTGNLTLPDENTTGIVIEASSVTIDLGGFAIIGPVECVTAPPALGVACSATGSTGFEAGITVDLSSPAFIESTTLRNGTIRGVGGFAVLGVSGRIEGIDAVSNAVGGILAVGLVEGCAARRNGGPGINVASGSVARGNSVIDNGESGSTANGLDCSGCVIKDNAVRSNVGHGISCSSNCSIENNFSSGNGGAGISADGGSLRGNTVSGNTGFGLELTGSGYAGNTIRFNGGGTVSGGVELGLNLCGTDTTCP